MPNSTLLQSNTETNISTEHCTLSPVASKEKTNVEWNSYNIPPYKTSQGMLQPTEPYNFPARTNPSRIEKKIFDLPNYSLKSLEVLQRVDLPFETKQKLEEVARRLGLTDLPRIKAQPNLHQRLIREFEATDSLLEFQRQMQMVIITKLIAAKFIVVVVR